MKVLIKLLFQRKSPWEREKCKFSQSHLSLGSIATKNMSKHKAYMTENPSTKITKHRCREAKLPAKFLTHFEIYHIPLLNCKPVEPVLM